MKKWLAFLLAVLFALPLTACGGGGSWQEQYDLGVRYLSEGNYQEAVIAFTAAIDIDPKRSEAYVGRGDAYALSGDTEDNLSAAQADYEAALAVLSLALVMSLVISKKLSEPLDEMTAAARRFAHGDFSVRVREDKGTDELAALTSSFNAMADSLERSEELRNEFIANVSHELKTPMTTIAGFADGILDGTIPKDQEDKYLATIADETRRLSRLVRHMLSLSRMRSEGSDMTKRRDFDLNELIIRTMLNFETRCEDKRLDVDLQLPEVHMSVTADPDSITQVLYNLVDNAVKFADPGTPITVGLRKENGKAYVSVKNLGESIPADDLPLIFDRFHKSDRSRSRDRDGVGLGLYLVKSILDAHNEDIAVTSEGGATEFVFTLTLSRDKPKSEKAKAEKASRSRSRRRAAEDAKDAKEPKDGPDGA